MSVEHLDMLTLSPTLTCELLSLVNHAADLLQLRQPFSLVIVMNLDLPLHARIASVNLIQSRYYKITSILLLLAPALRI